MGLRHKIPSIIAYIMMIVGFLAIMGWIFNISYLRSINPAWAPMKFVTGACFIISGLIFLTINKIFHGEYEVTRIVLSAGSLALILLTSFFLASNIFKIPVGIERLFIGEITKPGKNFSLQPCSASMLNFFIIAVVGIIFLNNPKVSRLVFLIPGILIGLVGLSSIIGHTINISVLSFDIPGISVGMSAISGPLFVLTGIGFYMLYSCDKKQ